MFIGTRRAEGFIGENWLSYNIETDFVFKVFYFKFTNISLVSFKPWKIM